ncbi:MAG: sodium:solute symporter family protein, partial [Leptospirillia bacterium]
IPGEGGDDQRQKYDHRNPDAAEQQLGAVPGVGVTVIVFLALIVATFSRDALVLLGGLAVAFGFQMWPSLMAICYFPWITRQGATWGLAAGLVGVILTETIGRQLFGGVLPWGRWPLTVHSAGWGILANLTVCLTVSAFTQSKKGTAHRMIFHQLLRDYAAVPKERRPLIPMAWGMVLLWFFLAVGPGAVLGNTVFGQPHDAASWMFGIPSIWAWQILFWALGVGMMWFLAYKVGLSTLKPGHFPVARDDVGELPPERQPHG